MAARTAGAAAVAQRKRSAEEDPIEVARQREALESGAGDGDGEPGERDKLFREAAEVVIQHQQGSTSLLQRRLKVGYGRAARIIDQLHCRRCAGPAGRLPPARRARGVRGTRAHFRPARLARARDPGPVPWLFL
jgi:DNA segregation ATPase FtsK/SpoIIIE-like protein